MAARGSGSRDWGFKAHGSSLTVSLLSVIASLATADLDIVGAVWSITKWLLALGAVGVVGWIVWTMVRSDKSAATSTSPSSSGGKLDFKARRTIKQHIAAGDYAGAADIASHGGDFVQAADLYERAGALDLAGDAWVSARDLTRAVETYERGGLYLRAAEKLEAGGRPATAAEKFLRAKRPARAAEIYERIGQWDRAAEAWEESADPRRAGLAWTKAGEEHADQAGRCFLRHIKATVKTLPKQGTNDPQILDSARRAASFMTAQGKREQGAKILGRVGLGKEAAELLVEHDSAAAASILAKSGELDEAASLLSNSGDKKAAARIRAKAALEAGDERAAADAYTRASDHDAAGDLYAKLGDDAAAAAAYEEAGDFVQAAEHWLRIDDVPRAARCYEHGGLVEDAIGLYQKLGDTNAELRLLEAAGRWYDLGVTLTRLGKLHAALASLEKVTDLDPRFREAVRAQGDILAQLKQFERAYRRYDVSLGDEPISTNNVSVFYKMGRCAESFGDKKTALALYESVARTVPGYKDAEDRIEAIKRGGGSVGTANATLPTPQGPVRYRVVKELARGGMGVVFVAHDETLDRNVAFKVLGERVRNIPDAADYFLREARAAAKLNHENLVTIFDAGQQQGDLYLAMELLDGHDMKTVVKRKGALPESLVIFVGIETCKGLAYAHQHGVIHRDIKSSNVMLTRDRRVKIMDFGLAKIVEAYQQQDHTKAVGTPHYMSPEQVLGNELGPRSDLYSLGVMLFELSTGSLPFDRGQVVYHHLHTAPPDPKSINPSVSDGLRKIVLSLLGKQPSDRPASAEQVQAALEELA